MEGYGEGLIFSKRSLSVQKLSLSDALTCGGWRQGALPVSNEFSNCFKLNLFATCNWLGPPICPPSTVGSLPADQVHKFCLDDSILVVAQDLFLTPFAALFLSRDIRRILHHKAMIFDQLQQIK